VNIQYASAAICALVDNEPNTLQQAEAFDQAAWSKSNATVTANTAADPLNLNVADSLTEDATASSTHFVTQSTTKPAAAQDWCGAVFAKANTRSQCALQIGQQSTNFARVVVDLSTGNIATAAANNGTVTNARAFVRNMGNGWFYIALVANIPASITTTNMLVMLALSGSPSYSGDGASGIFITRGGYAQASFPFLPGQTTTPAFPSGKNQTGSGLRLRGGTPSLAGAAFRGDFAQIVMPNFSQLVRLTDSLDFDAAGMGWMNFEPALKQSPVDGAAVIFHEPMGRFMFAGGSIGVEITPGVFGQASLDFVEAT
jgi:hypothetical protein